MGVALMAEQFEEQVEISNEVLIDFVGAGVVGVCHAVSLEP